MKLIRYGAPGEERPGLVDAQGVLRDLSMLLADIGPAQLAPRTLAALAAIDAARLPAGVRYAAASPAYAEDQTPTAGYDTTEFVDLPRVAPGARMKPTELGKPIRGITWRLDGEGSEGELLVRSKAMFFGYLNEPNSNHPWNLGASTTGTAHRIPFVITAGHSFRFGRGDRAAFGVHLYAGVVHWISSYDVRFPSYGVAGSSTVERTAPHLGVLLRFTYRPHPIVGLAVQLWAPFYGVGPGTVVSLFAVGAGVTFRAR